MNELVPATSDGLVGGPPWYGRNPACASVTGVCPPARPASVALTLVAAGARAELPVVRLVAPVGLTLQDPRGGLVLFDLGERLELPTCVACETLAASRVMRAPTSYGWPHGPHVPGSVALTMRVVGASFGGGMTFLTRVFPGTPGVPRRGFRGINRPWPSRARSSCLRRSHRHSCPGRLPVPCRRHRRRLQGPRGARWGGCSCGEPYRPRADSCAWCAECRTPSARRPRDRRLVKPRSCRRSSGPEHVEDGRVVLEPRAHLAERIKREVAQTWRGEGSAVDELIAQRRDEAAREAGE